MLLLKQIYGRYSYRRFTTTSLKKVKIAVLGAGGGIGQPLSLLMKMCPLVTELSLYDIKHAEGVAADIGHINVRSVIRGSNGPESLKNALHGMEIVVIPAGVPRKPGMTRDDLFNVNASVVRDLVEACAKNCPKALIAVITNPVNSLVAVAAEVLKKHGVFDPGRLFGVTTLDLVRASTFLGDLKKANPNSISVPCIAGHSGITIIPLFSQCKPKYELSQEEVEYLTPLVQEAGTEVVKAKAGAGSATLSTAYAASRFLTSLCHALAGQPDVVECAYVASNLTEVKYFSSPLLLGKNGVMKILPLPSLSNFECEALKKAIPELKKNIEKGEKFVQE